MKSTKCKFLCQSVEKTEYSETIKMSAVTDKDFDKEGISDDNEFSKWSPSGSFEIQITNPAVHGFFVPGKKYYFDIVPEETGE